MDLSQKRIGPRLVLSFPTRVDLEGAASEEFKSRLKRLVAEGGENVVMDLGNVGFIDSCGLGALISALKVLRTSGGSLVLANVSESVEAVLRITRLARVFDVCPAVEDALEMACSSPVRDGEVVA
jgi:anti-sigma B factor antagonist